MFMFFSLPFLFLLLLGETLFQRLSTEYLSLCISNLILLEISRVENARNVLTSLLNSPPLRVTSIHLQIDYFICRGQ